MLSSCALSVHQRDLFVSEIQGLTYLTMQFDKEPACEWVSECVCASVCVSVPERACPRLSVFAREKEEEKGDMGSERGEGERERMQCDVLIALILQAMQLWAVSQQSVRVCVRVSQTVCVRAPVSMCRRWKPK